MSDFQIKINKQFNYDQMQYFYAMCEKINPAYEPKVDFSGWDEGTLIEFQRLMEDNLVELRKIYESVCSRLINIISFNGVILSLLFVAIFEGSRSELGGVLLASVVSIMISTVIAIIGAYFRVKIADQYSYTDEDLILNKHSLLGLKKVATNTTIDMIDAFENVNDLKHGLVFWSGVFLFGGILLISYAVGCVVIS